MIELINMNTYNKYLLHVNIFTLFKITFLFYTLGVLFPYSLRQTCVVCTSDGTNITVNSNTTFNIFLDGTLPPEVIEEAGAMLINNSTNETITSRRKLSVIDACSDGCLKVTTLAAGDPETIEAPKQFLQIDFIGTGKTADHDIYSINIGTHKYDEIQKVIRGPNSVCSETCLYGDGGSSWFYYNNQWYYWTQERIYSYIRSVYGSMSNSQVYELTRSIINDDYYSSIHVCNKYCDDKKFLEKYAENINIKRTFLRVNYPIIKDMDVLILENGRNPDLSFCGYERESCCISNNAIGSVGLGSQCNSHLICDTSLNQCISLLLAPVSNSRGTSQTFALEQVGVYKTTKPIEVNFKGDTKNVDWKIYEDTRSWKRDQYYYQYEQWHNENMLRLDNIFHKNNIGYWYAFHKFKTLFDISKNISKINPAVFGLEFGQNPIVLPAENYPEMSSVSIRDSRTNLVRFSLYNEGRIKHNDDNFYVTSVRYQYGRYCWAYTATALLETAIAWKYNRKVEDYDISEMIGCTYEYNPDGGYGDDTGHWSHLAYESKILQGSIAIRKPNKGARGYEGDLGNCKWAVEEQQNWVQPCCYDENAADATGNTCRHQENCNHWTILRREYSTNGAEYRCNSLTDCNVVSRIIFNITDEYSVAQSIRKVKQALVTDGALSIIFMGTAMRGFLQIDDEALMGVNSCAGSTLYSGHVMQLVGWNDEGFIIRNSHGHAYSAKKFGFDFNLENGHFVLEYPKVLDDINRLTNCYRNQKIYVDVHKSPEIIQRPSQKCRLEDFPSAWNCADRWAEIIYTQTFWNLLPHPGANYLNNFKPIWALKQMHPTNGLHGCDDNLYPPKEHECCVREVDRSTTCDVICSRGANRLGDKEKCFYNNYDDSNLGFQVSGKSYCICAPNYARERVGDYHIRSPEGVLLALITPEYQNPPPSPPPITG